MKEWMVFDVTDTFKRVLRYSICVSGAASGETVRESYQKALELGRAIAKSGQI